LLSRTKRRHPELVSRSFFDKVTSDETIALFKKNYKKIFDFSVLAIDINA